jgi:hypothetical protein
MTLRAIAAALCALLLSACVTFPDISQSRSPCRLEPGGWCAFVREAAVEAFPYAIAATNAYTGDDELFRDSGPLLEQLERLPIAPEDAAKGFDYAVFAQYKSGSRGDAARVPVARILAFRGTDLKSLSDIFYGSVRSDQIDIAIRYFEAEQQRWKSDVPWIVTGHSLGGALATEVSVRHPEVRAYMFNTSPFYKSEVTENAAKRTVFNERGEVLRRFARHDIAPAANVFTINCEPRKNTITKHKVRPLADCIIWIAAYASADALAVVKANGITKPFVECERANQVHPGPGFVQRLPCVHSGRLQEDRGAIEPGTPSR